MKKPCGEMSRGEQFSRDMHAETVDVGWSDTCRYITDISADNLPHGGEGPAPRHEVVEHREDNRDPQDRSAEVHYHAEPIMVGHGHDQGVAES